MKTGGGWLASQQMGKRVGRLEVGILVLAFVVFVAIAAAIGIALQELPHDHHPPGDAGLL